jgi:hypothetical protein
MVEDEMVEGRGMCWKMREGYWGRREREEDEGRVLREEGNDRITTDEGRVLRKGNGVEGGEK